MISNISYFDELLDAGNEEFEFIFRSLLNDENETLYELVKENIPAFYEPLLSSYYNPKLERRYSIEQIMYGYIEDEEFKKNNYIAVKSDNSGIVYLPKVGYFYTGTKKSDFFIKLSENGHYELFAENKEVISCQFQPVQFLSGSDIEINFDTNAIIDQFFVEQDSPKLIKESAEKYREPLEKALNLIRTEFPFFYEWLENTVTNIVLFESSQRNSFASMFIKGAAFINVINQKPNEIFFIEEITHQCGHVVFYPMSIDRQKLFTCDCETPMSHFTGIEADDRDVLNAYYAFFPQLFGDLIFDMCLEHDLIKDEQHRAELFGRYAFRMYKYGLGVKQFDEYNQLLSDYGREMFARFKDGYNELNAKRAADFAQMDVSNQVYVFDVDLYKRTNNILTEKV